MSLENLILKGQCRLGHRSNFCFSEVLGSIWIKVGECMDFNVSITSERVQFTSIDHKYVSRNDKHIRKFPRFQ